MNLVACNIYITAGRLPQHIPVLLNLLQQAQKQCRDDPNVVVVHAFADRTYNRTSFHFAAKSAQNLVSVTSELAKTALREFQTSTINSEYFHPHVGVVDHISVMSFAESQDINTDVTSSDVTEMTRSAREIGRRMEDMGQIVHFYGHAHPNNLPLAQVRREKTPFFHHEKDDTSSSSQSTKPPSIICLVGVPKQFVENYNVRVLCSSKSVVSRTLTQRLRERDGGIVGVEALTLPYGDGCWEVAMNLLRPNLVPSIQQIVSKWKEGTVLKAYRVGSTVEQCQRSLLLEDRKSHDASVMKQLEMYLLESFDC
jgi:glutamate formiminotransferase